MWKAATGCNLWAFCSDVAITRVELGCRRIGGH